MMRYCTTVDADDRAALVAATKAIEQAQPGERQAARDARRDLIAELGRRLRGDRYPNRWNPVISDIAEATGMHRTQVSRIVNGTRVVRHARPTEKD